MVLERASADELVFSAKRRAPRPLVFAGAVFSLMALLPLLSPGPITPLRVVGATALATIAIALIARSWGRARRVELDLRGRRVLLASGEWRSLDLASSYALVDGDDPAAPGLRYGVDLVVADGVNARILEGSDPARLLSDLGRALEFFALPVARGWGLPLGAEPWHASALPPAHVAKTAPLHFSCDRWSRQRHAGLTVVVGALVIGVLMAVMLLARVRRGLDVSLLSLGLSVGTIGALMLAGAAVGTACSRVRANGEVTIELLTLGLTRRRRSLPRAAIVRAHLIGPDGTNTSHVLLETTEGPVAMPCSGDAALRLQQALSPAQPP